MNKEKFIKICPRCGNTDISFTSISGADAVDWCKLCNYKSTFFPEIKETEVEKFKNNIKNKS